MEILGKVTAAAGNIVTVEISGREICSQCGIASDSQLALGCNSCSLVEDKKQKYLQAVNPLELPVKTGDTVAVSLSTRKAISTGFFIFIMPLLLFFLFYFLAEQLFLWRTEFFKLLAGIGGIVVGFVLVFIRRAFLKDKEWPCVKKIISP